MSITSFLNPYSYWVIRKYPELLGEPSFRYEYDGISLCVLARLLGRKRSRVSFDDTSLAPEIFSEAARKGYQVILVGSKPGVAEEAGRILRRRHPELLVSFTHHGFMSELERERVLSRCLTADVVVCSMGTPHQERFLLDLVKIGWRGNGYTCGGYLDQLVSSDGASYYPSFVDALHIRWLYRVIREPRRLLYRYVFIYPVGCLLFIVDNWRYRKSKPIMPR